ncbi:MAG: phosphomannomutase/phosphoglucomutase [Bacteroidales bacterium]|nr:phosphomannomutase/phosphoglucomutase [Bacteroidales bacterium]MBQ9194321.1 phosphomannomutase/phosphoglucomutase [Bacteroidales bacterium]
MGAFHAYDIRGIWGKDWDLDIAYKVGYFVPQLLKADKVLVGRDCRVSSDEIHDAVVKGINDAGADVYDIGLSSTPMVYFGTANYGFDASIQITASHNPAEYNGMKVSTTDAQAVGFDAGLGQIKAWIDEGKPTPVAAKRGQVFQKEIMADYLQFMRKFVKDYSGLTIAMDLSNGMANLFAKEIFGTGSNIHYLFDTLDGRFPNHEPNPLIEKNCFPLEEKVREMKADAGVIYDGDADRVMFVDEKGQFISPDLMIALMGNYFVKERGLKGLVLQDIRSSKAVGEYLSPMGCEMRTWKVGRAFAAKKLREIDGVWGGELAGHYYFRDFFYSDSGLLASIILLNIVAGFKKEGKTLSQAIAEIVRYQNSGEINYRIEDKKGAMDAVKDYFMAQEKATAFMDFDGYRVEFPDWWFNIRPSNTEPYLRFICEATSARLLQEKITQTDAILVNQFGGKR